nr:hypothetical protein [Bifidobacterium platyrrhinorum]
MRHDLRERRGRGRREILILLVFGLVCIHLTQQVLRRVRAVERHPVLQGHAAAHLEHVLQEHRVDRDHAVHVLAGVRLPQCLGDHARTREIGGKVHIHGHTPQFVGEQRALLRREIHHRFVEPRDLSTRNERLHLDLAVRHRHHAP